MMYLLRYILTIYILTFFVKLCLGKYILSLQERLDYLDDVFQPINDRVLLNKLCMPIQLLNELYSLSLEYFEQLPVK